MNKYQKAVSKLVMTDQECGLAKRLKYSRQYTKRRHLRQLRKRNWTVKQILRFKNDMKGLAFQQKLDRICSSWIIQSKGGYNHAGNF